jgi:hypothetical protein
MNKELLKEEKSTRLYTGSCPGSYLKKNKKISKAFQEGKKKSLILGSSSVSVICEPLALRESKKKERKLRNTSVCITI